MRASFLTPVLGLVLLVAGGNASAGPPDRAPPAAGLGQPSGRIDDLDPARGNLIIDDMGYRLDPATAVRREDGSLMPRSKLERGMRVRLRVRRTLRRSYPFLLDEVVILDRDSGERR